ncbi:hypothetical protein OIE68_42310 [Nocardia vinacea]|uniref:hypothetical protein n=1 Tax=Nocardia vinacea TaxID=96468 RepID=UPI002E0F8A1B|nr:hypothetical protein OIE68_42310 [Nocardia vinacea]
MTELYVDQPAVEGMIGALNQSRDVLAGVPTSSFIAAIESALPGSGLGHAYLKAGWRGGASVRGVNAQLTDITDKAGISIVEYNNRDQHTAGAVQALEDAPR